MQSVKQMLERLSGLLGTSDLTDWEQEFVGSVLDRVRARGGDTTTLTDKQVEKIDSLYRKHFAG